MHICGERGCEFVPDDDARDKYVAESRMRWALRWEAEHGDFPGAEAQIRFVIKEAHAYDKIIGPKLRAEEHHRRVELAETEARIEYMRRVVSPTAQEDTE